MVEDNNDYNGDINKDDLLSEEEINKIIDIEKKEED